MENYDMGKKYDDTIGLNIVDLCKELINEESLSEDFTEEYYRDKFHNNDKSGLSDKLDKKLGFCILDFVKKGDKRERHAQLKLLKALYRIEKSGDPKKSKSKKEDTRICITDILTKPRLDNIPSDITTKSEFGVIFNKLFNDVKKEIVDPECKAKRLETLNAHWEYITEISFDYVTTDGALNEPRNAMQELERIEKFLNKVIERLPKENKRSKLPYKENLMDTFYNILLSHRMLCNDIDRMNINYQICIEKAPNEEYIQHFREYDKNINREFIPELKQMIKADNNGPIAILFGIENYNAERFAANYDFAWNHIDPLLDWIEKDKRVDFSKAIPLLILVACVQEIVFVKQTDERFKNDFYGNKYTEKPLLVALKKPEKADAVIIKAWIKKIENRLAVNFGTMKLLVKKREIENLIYKIKQYVYSYMNFEELEFVNNILMHFVSRCMISRGYAMQVGDRFAKRLSGYLNDDIHDFKVVLWPEAANVYDMFREFILNEKIEDEVASVVANDINEFYSQDGDIIAKSYWNEFYLHYSNAYDRKFMYEFMIDRTNNQYEHKQFFEVVSDGNKDEMIRLGLGNFVL